MTIFSAPNRNSNEHDQRLKLETSRITRCFKTLWTKTMLPENVVEGILKAARAYEAKDARYSSTLVSFYTMDEVLIAMARDHVGALESGGNLHPFGFLVGEIKGGKFQRVETIVHGGIVPRRGNASEDLRQQLRSVGDRIDDAFAAGTDFGTQSEAIASERAGKNGLSGGYGVSLAQGRACHKSES